MNDIVVEDVKAPISKSHTALSLSFDKNHLLPELFGEHERHLRLIEEELHISAMARGGLVSLQGAQGAVFAARDILENLYDVLNKGGHIDQQDVLAALRMVEHHDDHAQDNKKKLRHNRDVEIKTLKSTIRPFSNRQADYVRLLQEHDVVFAHGPAGTGKTFLAVAVGVQLFLEGKVERLILSRPAVEAGEKLGFLPGDLKEKIDPYLRPLFDALHDMLPAEKIYDHMENNIFEIAPLAFMRGRTLSRAFVILDEAQNTTATQMKMFLTRLGENSRMVVTGDLSQTDLPRGIKSGLRDASEKLFDVEGIGQVRFSDEDVVRHPLAARIVQAYERHDAGEQLDMLKEIADKKERDKATESAEPDA